MIRPTSSANVAKGNMPHRQNHFPHGSAAIMRPTHFTGKMFPSALCLFALHNLLRQTHFFVHKCPTKPLCIARRAFHAPTALCGQYLPRQTRFAPRPYAHSPHCFQIHAARARHVDHPLAFVQREYSADSFNTFRTADSIHYSSTSHTLPHCFQIHVARARHVDHPRVLVQYKYSADSFDAS